MSICIDGATPTPYAWDNANPEAQIQHRNLAAVLDPHSTSVLLAAGVRPGMRCLDVGAGGGSISVWLADRVGPFGTVDAVDTDPRYIPGGRPNLTVHAANVVDMCLPVGAYDLIHARLVLMHLPDREVILAKLVAALALGGILVVSDWDCEWRDLVLAAPSEEDSALHDKFQVTLFGIGERRGMDSAWARKAHPAMCAAGLTDVLTVSDARSYRGGTGICLLHHSNSIQMREPLLDGGMTSDELDRFRALMRDPRLVLSSYLMHTTVGRRSA